MDGLPLRVYVAGGSMTIGRMGDPKSAHVNDEKHRWSAQLENFLRAALPCSVEVKNIAKGGTGVASLLSSIDTIIRQPEPPHLLILDYALNDGSNSEKAYSSATPADEVAAKLTPFEVVVRTLLEANIAVMHIEPWVPRPLLKDAPGAAVCGGELVSPPGSKPERHAPCSYFSHSLAEWKRDRFYFAVISHYDLPTLVYGLATCGTNGASHWACSCPRSAEAPPRVVDCVHVKESTHRVYGVLTARYITSRFASACRRRDDSAKLLPLPAPLAGSSSLELFCGSAPTNMSPPHASVCFRCLKSALREAKIV